MADIELERIQDVATVLGGPTILYSVAVAGFALLLVAGTAWLALRRASDLGL